MERSPIQRKDLGGSQLTSITRAIRELQATYRAFAASVQTFVHDEIASANEDLRSEYKKALTFLNVPSLKAFVRDEIASIFAVLGKELEAKIAEIHIPSDGYTPQKGVDYFDGIDGKTPQKGVDYFDGAPGKPGKPGKDAIAPVINTEDIIKTIAAQIEVPTLEQLIAALLDAGLEVSHIKGLQEQLTAVRRAAVLGNGQMHGGGDTVKAGSNITITTDADGKRVIASTGGSGFTELSATEIPNNSTTIFTFAAAAAQPSYIVSDNVWQKATSKAGTVNWTWNAGAKKATMTVPPADDIFAIV